MGENGSSRSQCKGKNAWRDEACARSAEPTDTLFPPSYALFYPSTYVPNYLSNNPKSSRTPTVTKAEELETTLHLLVAVPFCPTS